MMHHYTIIFHISKPEIINYYMHI
ncbi:unnamed protein product [Spirodela intermedia]|uniref:Uncharacterized protein n=1 Tax=Spirodela intermedia TaxID=51605 RepID=A0A7I8LK73_SPIIN|nr:unnamed protein product [Spirodela intermedia]